MAYTPGNVPTDPAQLPAYLVQEQQKIAAAMNTQVQTLSLDTLYAYPPKFREGTIFKADGVTLNPGFGAGVYCRTNGVWAFLG